jgi:hypothetical protein
MKYKKIIPLLLAVVIGIVGFITPMLIPSTAAPNTAKNETVLWFDDFEANTNKWLGVGSGSVSRSTVMAFSGEASLNVTALTWDIEEALRQIGSPEYPLPVLTVDFWFSLPSTGYGYFVFGLEYCSLNRDTWFRSGIMLSGEYENEAGHWATIEGFPSGLDLADNYGVWHYASLTVDLANGNYISLTIDDYTFDLELLGYQCYDRTLEGSPVLWGVAYPYFYSGGGYDPCSILIDDVRLCKQ